MTLQTVANNTVCIYTRIINCTHKATPHERSAFRKHINWKIMLVLTVHSREHKNRDTTEVRNFALMLRACVVVLI